MAAQGDWSSIFVTSARRHFGFLVTDYGFKELEPRVFGYECSLIYQRLGEIGVVVLTEAGCAPFVMIGAVCHDAKGRAVSRDFALDYVIDELCPELVISAGEAGDHDARADRLLEQYAAALKQCGHGLLTGDRSMVPAVLARASRAFRKRDLDDWVTESLWSAREEGRTVASIIADIADRDRKRHSAKRVEASLARLTKRGQAVAKDGRWFPVKS